MPRAGDDLAQVEGSRLLLADDNADMRQYVSRLLSKHLHVEAVADGAAALAAIRANRPDLVLTDVMMPELDGFGLLKAIREDAELRDLPVIMLSARAGEEARIEGLDAGRRRLSDQTILRSRADRARACQPQACECTPGKHGGPGGKRAALPKHGGKLAGDDVDHRCRRSAAPI